MDVTEMDQKPTSSGVRNKQKQNKALAFRWKAVSWAARARAQGRGKVGACLEDAAVGEARGRRGMGQLWLPSHEECALAAVLGGGVLPHGPGCGGHGCGGTEGAGMGRHLPGGPEMASPPLGECAVSQFKQNPGGNCSTMNSQLSSVSIKLVKLLVKKRKRQKQQFTCRAIVLFFAGYFPTSPCSFRFLNFLK